MWKCSKRFSSIQNFRSQSWIRRYLNSALWWNKFIENFKDYLRKGNIWNKRSFFKVQVVYISLLKVKTSSEMSSPYKKDFAWKILFAKLNNRNSSSSKAILKKEQTFWWIHQVIDDLQRFPLFSFSIILFW